MCEIKRLFGITAWSGALALLVAGCGLQGPLYLPQTKPPPQTVLVPVTKTGDAAPDAVKSDDEKSNDKGDAEEAQKTSPAKTAP